MILAGALVVATASSVLWMFSRAVSAQVEQTADRRLTEGAAGYLQTLRAQQQDVAVLGDLLAKDTDFVAALEHGQLASAAGLLQLTLRPPVSSIALLQRDGRPFLEASGDTGGGLPADLAKRPAFVEALRGRDGVERSFNAGHTLEQAVYVPVLSAGQQLPLAVLRLAALEGTDQLNSFRAVTGLHASLFEGAEAVATTLRAADGTPLINEQDTAANVQAAARGIEQHYSVNAPAGRIRVYSEPLLDTSGAIVGVVAVGLPDSAILGELRRALMPDLPVTGAILLAGALLAFLLCRQFARPLFVLKDAAQRLQTGDLTTPIPELDEPEFIAVRDELESARHSMKRRMEDLVTREARQRELFDAIREPVLIATPDGSLDGWNRAAEALFGPWRLRGRSIQDLLPFLPENPLATELSLWQGTMQNSEDRVLDVEVNHAFLASEPESLRHVFVIHDVSAYAELSRQREDMLHSVAHELANPLSILQLSLDLLSEDEAEDEADTGLVSSAQRTVRRLNWLTQNLLNAGAIQSGRFQITRLDRDLRTVLTEAATNLKEVLDQRSQTIDVQLPAESIEVLVDQGYIHQATYNLLTNASKYSPTGSVIKLGARLEPKHVRVSVIDAGPGIAPEHRIELFQRFYRADAKREGVGLGLAIVKGIIEAHGGEVGVESEPGQGSTFWYTLPLNPASHAASDA